MIITLLFFNGEGGAQNLFIIPDSSLGIDTNYMCFMYSNPEIAGRLASKLETTDKERFVLMHFGASHIQAEILTSKSRSLFQDRFGEAGPGMAFTFSAAKSYNSINYTTEHTGTWKYAKSYMLPPSLPLGPRGMTIETTEPDASLGLLYKKTLKASDYRIFLFIDNHKDTPPFEVIIDNNTYSDSIGNLVESSHKNTFTIDHTGSIDKIRIKIKGKDSTAYRFRFYGLSIENIRENGFMYHSLGVGASPFEAVLYMEKMEEQFAVLKPDMVIIDYGTNNILYKNKIDPSLPGNIVKAIQNFRSINPELLVVLTSTQDLYRKGKHIDAAIKFNKLVDSIARTNDCFFWNFYDLSGGYGRIRKWMNAGYAQKDGVHLTHKGYELKGQLLYHSLIRTMEHATSFSDSTLAKEPKSYGNLRTNTPVKETSPKPGKTTTGKQYVVKPSDNLWTIASRHKTTVEKLKKLNGLKNDLIRPGQKLIIK